MRWLGSAVACACALAALPAAASPAEQFGFGPRSQAMAGTGVAVSEGFEASYENPALLSRSRQRELALGWQAARFDLYADGPNAPGDTSNESLAGTFIGAVLPLPFGGFLEDRLTAGLGVFTPRSLIARARLLYPERAQFPVLTDRAQTLNFNMGLGVDLGYGLRLGAGAMVLAELVGTVVVRTDASGRVGTIVDDQLVATYAPLAGAAYETDDWRFGLVWRGELEGEFDVVVSVFDLGALVVPDLHISGIAQYDPMQVGAEAGYRLDAWNLVGGLTYKRWSAFPGWSRATVVCPSEQPDCQALVPAGVGFHDTLVPRIAVERDIPLARSAVGHVRAGYFFEPSPVPEQTGLANHFDNDRHALTVGYGVELIEPLPPIRLDFFYQHHLLAPRTHRKKDSVPDSNAGYPEVKTGGSVQNVGLMAGVAF